MVAQSSREEQKKRRRRRLVKGLLVGGVAVGVPALINALVAKRSQKLGVSVWGRAQRYAWRHGEISFQELGTGAPVVLIHSFGPGHDGEEWRAAGESLARTRRVFAPDLLGWGRSEKPKITFDGELFIQFLADFIEDVVGGRADLVAAGLPAAYAVQVAVDRPELIRTLTLSTPSSLELRGEEPDLKDALVHKLLRLPVLGTSALNLYTSRTSLAHYLRREVFSVEEKGDAAIIERLYNSSHQPGGHSALAAYLSGYLNHHIEEALPRLGVPLLLVWGRDSTSPPVEAADLWLSRFPEAQLEVMETCGSLPHLEQPARFVALLEKFIDRTDS